MANPNNTACAACGATGELHEHHLVPRVHGGHHLPTVWLCTDCHGRAHARKFSSNHRELTIAGLNAARVKGKKLGSPNRQGKAVVSAMKEAARQAALAATAIRIAAEKAEIWADRLATLSSEVEEQAAVAAAKAETDLPVRQERAFNASRAKSLQARRRADDLMPFIEAAQKAGCITLGQIAEAMTARGIKTSGGGSDWTATTVRRVLDKAQGG